MSSPGGVAKHVMRAARKSPRRGDYSSGTQRALVDSAVELFTERGYTGTSLDEVVAAARVTKGALYHHFGSKLALFEAVFTHLQREATDEIRTALRSVDDPWARAEVGISTFLEACRRPEFRRICLQEGQIALGHERWQEAERDATFGILRETVTGLLNDVGPDLQELSEAVSVVFYGALRSAADFVSDATDPQEASEQVLAAIGTILLGMRSLQQPAPNKDGPDKG